MATSHTFNFKGGKELSRMGATWFVSYAYFDLVDKGHNAWKDIKTYSMRVSIYHKTKQYHKFWLKQVLTMSDAKLNTNKIGLNANQTKEMADSVLNSHIMI